VLHRLVRGAGTKGLSGIHPAVNGTLIRPLLGVRRSDLREWLVQKRENWREDSSNQDLRFTRNRIRHQVLTLLAELNPRIVETLAHTANLARAEESFWEEYLKPFREAWVRFEGGKAIIDLNHFRQAPAAVNYRVLRWTVQRLGPSMALDLEQVRILHQWALHGQSGKRLTLSHDLEAWKEFEHLILQGNRDRVPSGYEYPIQIPGEVNVKEAGVTFRFELVPMGTGRTRYNEVGGVLLDGKVAGFPLLLRNWRAGDAYQPEGHRNLKKLQDLFQRQRVPLHQRREWPVLVAGLRIVWARRLAPAGEFSVGARSSQAILIRELNG
jgi:tRNA(Ile)-lysidine synthase